MIVNLLVAVICICSWKLEHNTQNGLKECVNTVLVKMMTSELLVKKDLQPKATYYDLILQNDSLLSVTQIAKDYGMSAKKLNRLLEEEKVQYKQSGQWFLYQKYADKGYTSSKTTVLDADRSVMHTYWTQQGRLFIYSLLKSKGYLPLIEQMG
jgi:phage antirepressor YoqD-like protein